MLFCGCFWQQLCYNVFVMYVQSVSVKNYRNLKEQKVVLKNGLNVFCGLNAQGKTNFLECLVLSSLGKTPKSDKDKDIINWAQQSAVIKTEVVTSTTKSLPFITEREFLFL